MDDTLVRFTLRYSYIVFSAALLSTIPFKTASAREVFNYNALGLGLSNESLKALQQFTENNGMVPGKYRVDIYVNTLHVDHRDIIFTLDKEKKTLQPNLTKGDYVTLGVKPKATEKFSKMQDDATVLDIGEYIPQSSTDLQLDHLRLNISIPQVAMQPSLGSYVPPKMWDNGVPAMFVNYNMTGSNNQSRDNNSHSDSYYVNLTNGMNIGPWRLRNYSTYSNNDAGWKSVNTYGWRNIAALSSKLTAGESFTNADIFDSFQFSGVKLESNENMRPSGDKGFAPTIRGIAQSNAEVTVTQNGYVIYQAYVAPGPFEIANLAPVYSGGDMEVKIKESDGSERSFIQASSSVPIMRREGSMAYSLAGGKYRSGNNDNSREPGFAEGTLIYGLPWGITLYGGALGAEDYQSAAIGVGADLRQFGSVSLDVTAAKTTLANSHNDEDKGRSLRIQYARNFTSTNTNLTLAGYRYSTRNYYTFDEAINHNTDDDDDSIFAYQNQYTRHHRLQMSVSQSLNDYGSLNLTAYQQDYWGVSANERSVSLGYNNTWHSINYSLNYSYTQTPFSDSDAQFSLSLNMPFDSLLPKTNVSYSYNGDRDGKSQNSIGLGGSTLEDDNLTWGVQESYSNQGIGNSGNASASWRTRRGIANAGYSYDKHNERVNYGLTGAIVAHPHGISLSQPIGDTSILVNIPGVSDTRITNGTAIYTDTFGNALVPYASPFQRNNVGIDTKTLPKDAELQQAVQDVIPAEGAIAVAHFTPRLGNRLLLTLNRNGRPLPFGAVVTIAENDDGYSALIDDQGRVYLSGVTENQTVQIQWGNSPAERCHLPLTPELLSRSQQVGDLSVLSATCHQ